MMHKKGQAMVEYLMVVAIALLILVPSIIFFSAQANTITSEAAFAKLNSIGASLVETIDSVYILGADSKTTLVVNLPDGLKNITLLNYTSPPYPLSNDLIFHLEAGQIKSQLLFVSTYPFFIGNCSHGEMNFPQAFLSNAGRKQFQLTSCGGSVAVWYQ